MPEYRNPIVWITLANVIYLASYTVRDILWLRPLTVLAAALLIPYYAMQSVPLRVAIEWNAIFIQSTAIGSFGWPEKGKNSREIVTTKPAAYLSIVPSLEYLSRKHKPETINGSPRPNLEPFLEPFIAESTPKWLSGSS